ncbi:MAG: tetratricopeptide repeat protein [Elusimicrobia bacterium]|nr:tetratricopeptide repeat protein [Elusimicrobiota bacterium]MBD3412475.1 tetratricopeptide repeat protein [Elusimicrobiota bacterium]
MRGPWSIKLKKTGGKILAKRWVRKELHRNEIAVFLEKIIGFYKKNREAVIAGTGITIIVIVVVVYFIIQYRSLNVRAWDMLARAQSQSANGQIVEAKKTLEQVTQNFSRTPAATHALLNLAYIYQRAQDYDTAAETYQQVLDGSSNTLLLPFAYVGLGTALQDSGNLDRAITVYETFSEKYADHFLYPTALQSLAYCYENTGRLQDARSQYEKIITLYPNTIWSENAYSWLRMVEEKEKNSSQKETP